MPVSQLINSPYPNKLRLLIPITILEMNFVFLLQKIETLSVPSLERLFSLTAGWKVGLINTGLQCVYVIIFMKTAWTSMFLL